MRQFEFYEITGVVAPGMVLIVGAILLFYPEQQKAFTDIATLSFGSLGLGIILAYVAGQLLQAIGNALEKAWWCLWGGMPTDWIRSGKHKLIASDQINLFNNKLRIMLNEPLFNYSDKTEEDWHFITRQVYANVGRNGSSSRLDVFNGNYGLCRGLTSGFFLLFLWSCVSAWNEWRIKILLIILIGLALFRMHRFGVRYARELFIQFLEAPLMKGQNES